MKSVGFKLLRCFLAVLCAGIYNKNYILAMLFMDRLQFSGHQYVADKLMRTAGSRILIIGSLY